MSPHGRPKGPRCGNHATAVREARSAKGDQ
jgi:hypothetical protein